MDENSLTMNVDEVAKQLGVSRNLCYRLCREGKLPGCLHLGQKRMVISKAAIAKLLEGNTKMEG